jgi:hypothetical protein
VSTVDVDQDRLVDALGAALRYGGPALGEVPELLKRVLREGVWQDFTTRRGQPVHHERFADFVTTTPLAGLGSDVPLVRRIVADDTEALDLLDDALQNPSSIHAGNNVPSRPEGNSRAKALRKLRKDAPELHADVLAGNLSAHAAMVKAGYRPQTFTVRADSAESVAATLRRRLPADQLAELARLLSEG